MPFQVLIATYLVFTARSLATYGHQLSSSIIVLDITLIAWGHGHVLDVIEDGASRENPDNHRRMGNQGETQRVQRFRFQQSELPLYKNLL